MAKHTTNTDIGKLPIPLPGSILTPRLDSLPKNASVHFGQITQIQLYGPRDTVLKILDDREDEYNFTGQEAFYAIGCEYGRVYAHLDVHFFTKEGSKDVFALIMQTNNGFELLRPDKDFCKLEFKQHGTRLMLVIELNSGRVGDLGIMDALEDLLNPPTLPWVVRFFKRGLLPNELCCSLALWAR